MSDFGKTCPLRARSEPGKDDSNLPKPTAAFWQSSDLWSSSPDSSCSRVRRSVGCILSFYRGQHCRRGGGGATLAIMIWPYSILLLLLCVALCLVGLRARAPRSSAGVSDEDFARANDPDPNIAIAGCSAPVRAGNEDEEARPSAYYPRAQAYKNQGYQNHTIHDYAKNISPKPQ